MLCKHYSVVRSRHLAQNCCSVYTCKKKKSSTAVFDPTKQKLSVRLLLLKINITVLGEVVGHLFPIRYAGFSFPHASTSHAYFFIQRGRLYEVMSALIPPKLKH